MGSTNYYLSIISFDRDQLDRSEGFETFWRKTPKDINLIVKIFRGNSPEIYSYVRATVLIRWRF